MRRLCATALTVSLCAHPLLAEGPLARSATGQAARLAGDTTPPGAADRWKAVRLLEPPAAIVVTTADRTVSGTFVGFGGSTITVMRSGVAEVIDAGDILMVEKRVRRGSAVAAALGATGGLWLGSAVAVGLTFNTRCQRRCGAVEAGMFAAVFGVPIAAGYGAWRASSHLTEQVIYRRSPAAP
jgi:hypothetical protein